MAPLLVTVRVLAVIHAVVAALGVVVGLGFVVADAADTSDDWHGLGIVLGGMLLAGSVPLLVLAVIAAGHRRPRVASSCGVAGALVVVAPAGLLTAAEGSAAGAAGLLLVLLPSLLLLAAGIGGLVVRADATA